MKYLCLSAALLIAGCVPLEQERPGDAADSASVSSELPAEISQMLDELYHSLTYDGQQMPDFEMLRSKFRENAQLVAVGDTSFMRWENIDAYIRQYRQDIENGVVLAASEYELHHTGDVYANIAHVFSSYEARIVTESDTLEKRGINSIQLMKQGTAWRVSSIIWYDENAGHPIPERFLGSGDGA